LYSQGKLKEAEAACRKALALQPNYPKACINLALALFAQRKLPEAEAACRKAIALKPDYAEANGTLGHVLGQQGKFREAEAAFRKVLALQADDPTAYSNLAVALLNGRGSYKEAEDACRKAIELKPDYAEAYLNLGFALRSQGKYAESLSAFRRGNELAATQPALRSRALPWLRAAEGMAALEKKLPGVLAGEVRPAGALEAIALAQMCQQFKKRHAAAARLYADAFAVEPKLADDLRQSPRYNAACSAALAAAGEGEDAHLLPDKTVVMFRRWALDWLRKDLAVYNQLVRRNNATIDQAIGQSLSHWRGDPDLSSVRDPHTLARLPEPERAAWQGLWREVEELAKRTAKKHD
jgi:tetratricopeptide (TPR) repeat protein